MAVPIAVVLVWRETTSSDVDYEPIFRCTGAAVVAPPEVVPPRAPLQIELVRVSDIEDAISMVPWPDGGFLVARRSGQLLLLDDKTGATTTIGDIESRLGFGPEGGLLSVAVDPRGAHVYAHYTDEALTSHIVEWAREGDSIDLGSERELLEVDHPNGVHLGGGLVFGPDDRLYVGFGDGGDTPSDEKRVRDLGEPDGKILRIDPARAGDEPYTAPADNPFTNDADARPDVWAYGLRNPWRFSFDRATGDFWVADVGSNCWEEIDRVPGAPGGADFGYGNFEGFHAFLSDERDSSVFPVYEYSHDDGCAVLGGYVYRGTRAPSLMGRYLFADFCTPGIRGVRLLADGRVELADLGVEIDGVYSFAEDSAGEVYVLSASKGIFQLRDR